METPVYNSKVSTRICLNLQSVIACNAVQTIAELICHRLQYTEQHLRRVQRDISDRALLDSTAHAVIWVNANSMTQ